jgi:hypothetical protein
MDGTRHAEIGPLGPILCLKMFEASYPIHPEPFILDSIKSLMLEICAAAGEGEVDVPHTAEA